MKRIIFYLCIIFFCVLLLRILTIILRHNLEDKRVADKLIKYFSFFCFVIYISCVVYITILSREISNYQPFLDPLWRLKTAIDLDAYTLSIHYRVLTQPMLNIIMMIPLGFFIPWLFEYFRKRLMLSVMVGSIVSVIIELTQFCTSRGAFETEDILCNTIGCIVGVYIYKWVLKSVVET